jgi:hypothetical protein
MARCGTCRPPSPSPAASSLRSCTRPRVSLEGRRRLPADDQPGGLFNPLVRELNDTLYQFERPFVSDASKISAGVRTVRADPSWRCGEAHR